MLTDEQKRLYLERGGVSCPGCGSEDISGGRFECDAGIVWQFVDCSECGLAWQDNYNLTSVTTEDEHVASTVPSVQEDDYCDECGEIMPDEGGMVGPFHALSCSLYATTSGE